MRVISSSGVLPMSERMAGGLSGEVDELVMKQGAGGCGPAASAMQHPRGQSSSGRGSRPGCERPEIRNEKAGHDPQKQVERHADAREIDEAITARAEDIGVGLIADRGGETRAAPKHDGDGKGPCIQA